MVEHVAPARVVRSALRLNHNTRYPFSLPFNGMYSALVLTFPSNTIRVDANHLQYNLAISFSTSGESPPGAEFTGLATPLPRSYLSDLTPAGSFHSSGS